MPVSHPEMPTRPIEAGGDFAAFYDRTSSWVYGLVVRIVGDHDRAGDVVAAAFANAARWPELDDSARRKRLVNCARELALADRALTGRATPAAGAMDAGRAAPPGAAAAGAIVPLRRPSGSAPIQGVWSRLEAIDREILSLAYFQGATVAAIAAAANRSESDVRARLRQALGRVAAHSKVREARP